MPQSVTVYCSASGTVLLYAVAGARPILAALADGYRLDRGLYDEFPRVFGRTVVSGWTGEEALRRGVLRLRTASTLPA